MLLVDCPCFTAVEKGGEDCSLVYLDLGLGCDASPIPDLFVESAKSGTRFSESGFQLIVYDDGSREGTAEVGELVQHVHDFSLLSADRQAKFVSGLYELVNPMLHVGF